MSSGPIGRTTRSRTTKAPPPSDPTPIASGSKPSPSLSLSPADGNLPSLQKTRPTKPLSPSHKRSSRHAARSSASSSSTGARRSAEDTQDLASPLTSASLGNGSSPSTATTTARPARPTVSPKPRTSTKRGREDTESASPAQPRNKRTDKSPSTTESRAKGKATAKAELRASTATASVQPRRSPRTSASGTQGASPSNSRSSDQSASSKRPRRDSSSAYNLRPRASDESASSSGSSRGAKSSEGTLNMPPSQTSSAKAARSKARRSKSGGGRSNACDPVDDAEMADAFAADGLSGAQRSQSVNDDGDEQRGASEGDVAEGDPLHAEEDDAEDDEVVEDMENMDDDDDEDDDGGQYEDEMDDAWGDEGGAAFGSNLRIMAEYLSGAQGRFRTLLASLRSRKDPTAQLIALQELSEVLSLSNEDTLAGYFPTESFTRELLYIMGGPKPPTTGGNGDNTGEEDDDAAAAEAAAAAADLVDRGEMTLLACRCLANLIEAMPYAAHSVVSYGAVPLLLSKLTEIEFIDLAEQTLQTLEKISVDYPGSIVREGGLMAMLQYLDFFNIHIQRCAMTAASHCCRKLSPDQFSKALEVTPIIRNVLGYSDQRLVESACKCITRMIESFKHQSDQLEQLLDKELVQALNALLLQGSPTSTGAPAAGTAIGTSTYTEVLKSLGGAVRISPKIAVVLLEINVVDTIYHLLTGSAPPNEDDEGGRGPAARGTSGTIAPAAQIEESIIATSDDTAIAVVGGDNEGVAVADMAVLQNLAHRPKEQIQEALSLVSDLLPPLPKDGIFDPRNYTEKAWYKKKKQHRAAREKSKGRTSDSSLASPTASSAQAKIKAETEDADLTGAAGSGLEEVDVSTASIKHEKPKTEKELLKERAQSRRIEMLRERQSVVKRFTQLVLPTLVEVYAASVALHVRAKALTGMLKIVSFVEAEPLCQVLDNVPLASFVASILSSRDDPTLVLSALHMVEILCEKLPDVYQSLLRREGVMWEIEDIATKEPTTSKYSTKGMHQSTLVLPGKSSATTEIKAEEASAPTQASDDTTGVQSAARLGLLAASAAGDVPNDALAALLGASNGLGLRRANPVSLSKAAAPAPTAADAQDANIWRARILRDTFARQTAKANGGADHAVKALENIKSLVKALEEAATESSEAAKKVLNEVTILFSKPDEPISSFELLRSGLVDGLYSFATGNSDALPNSVRRELLVKALMTPDGAGNARGSAMIRRLQESLSRLENVDIVMTLNSGAEEASSLRRLGQAGVHRQLRLRLQAEDPADVPKSCNNLIVGIHAIASFDRLADFLRPKIGTAGGLGGLGSIGGGLTGSRLSSVLAALGGSSAGLEGALASERARAALLAAPTPAPPAPTSTEGASGSSTSKDKGSSPSKKSRRRSSRLNSTAGSSKQDEDAVAADAAEQSTATHGEDEGTQGKGKEAAAGEPDEMTSDEAARRLLEGLLPDGLDDAYSDEEMDDGIYEDEIGADGEIAVAPLEAEDKTVSLSVAEDGDKVEVNTPDGTRISTPVGDTRSSGASATRPASDGVGTPKTAATTAAASTSSASPARPSYAAAAQRKPSDWHIEFSMDGRKIALDSTVYAAVHEHATATAPATTSADVPAGTAAVPQGSSTAHRYIWTDVYTIKYKKVAGPVPPINLQHTPEPESNMTAEAELPSSIPQGSPFAKVLQLLRVLHDLNSEWRETRGGQSLDFSKTAALSETAFVNNKLTAKLNRQLEEAMIVASKCLPDWSLQLPRRFSFLFPFEARYAFLQSTAFGYNRMLQRWQNRASRSQDNAGGNSNSSSSRLEDSLSHLVRLPRAKVRIARDNILPSAFRVMELYGKTDTILEVEYFGEVGTGLGPTLEFYALTSKEFARRDLGMWRDQSPADSTSTFVYAPHGLFPAPFARQELATSNGKGRLTAFKILGQFVAKAVLDSRIIDCHFSPVFMRAVLNQRVPLTLDMLKVIDSTLASSLEKMLEMSEDEIAALSLDFTLPGDSTFELVSGGKEKDLTKANLDAYVAAVVDVCLQSGIDPLVRSFRAGFNTIFPVSAMTSFTAEELVMLFGNTDEDWSESTLLSAIKPDHGYSSESSTFHDLISIMSSYTLSERREFLQWLTGSPKLPIGGFSGLQPQLTVVKRPHEAPLKPDDYLASNMSCANFLKLPEYSTREVMRSRLHKAVTEGAGAFNLS